MNYSQDTTIPWMPEEFLHVDGNPLVYTITKADGLLCRLPGGKSATVGALRAKGYDVVLPKFKRIFD